MARAYGACVLYKITMQIGGRMEEQLIKGEIVAKMVKRFKDLAMARHNLTIADIDPLYRASRTDELVWQMAGIAHVLLDMEEELDALYPELKLFLVHLVRTYPQKVQS